MYAIIFHAHQKLDRVAHRHLRRLLHDTNDFPGIKPVLHFEGKYGPDAAKFKNKENVIQPWHFMNPLDDTDRQLPKVVKEHYDNLVAALRDDKPSRAAFEAAWVAHAMVDGLTPAHHYPYEAELEDLRGSDRNSRTSLMSRVVVKGDNHADSLMKSLRLMGPKGLLTTHTMFEAGAYSIIAPLKLEAAFPDSETLQKAASMGIADYFIEQAKEVASYKMYDQFYETGWTPPLARLVRRELAPRMVRVITVAWYLAYQEAHAA